MKKVKAIIERASDGTYSIFMDAPEMDYLVTGTGETAAEAMQAFQDGYDDMKKIYEEKGERFEEVKFEYEYDTASFLSLYAGIFSLVGLASITGINKGQLSHYVTGRRKPSRSTAEKIQNSIRDFGKELGHVCIV